MLLIGGYAALSHYGDSSPDARGLGASLSVGPVVVIALILLWRWTKAWVAALCAVTVCGVLYRWWPFIEKNFEWADLVQQAGAYALVGWTFARSLHGGRTPLCTELAVRIHGVLTPREITYTRGATVAWTSFYFLLAGAIVVLFFSLSPRFWSLFVNFATFGLMIAMGLLDHAIRSRVLPRHPGGGILGVIRRAITG